MERIPRDSILAAAAALWAAFLLPPQLVAWSSADAPSWARDLADAGVYDGMLQLADMVGLTDPYMVFGAGVAPSFLLIGLAMFGTMHHLGRSGLVVRVLTLLGALLVVVSYAAAGTELPWRYLWGSEGPLLLAIGVAGSVAGIVAYRRGYPRRWSLLLASTLAVIVASTVLFGYFPHGTLIGFGGQVAALGWGAPTRPPRRRLPGVGNAVREGSSA